MYANGEGGAEVSGCNFDRMGHDCNMPYQNQYMLDQMLLHPKPFTEYTTEDGISNSKVAIALTMFLLIIFALYSRLSV